MNATAIRATIRLVDSGEVELEYTDWYGERRSRTFVVRRDGERGYVYEVVDGGGRWQVCERLSSQGSTLMADADTLLAVIRREHKRSRASA